MAGPSGLLVYALRLGPGTNIVTSLHAFIEDKGLKAPFVLSCVGSIERARLRLAHATAEKRNEVHIFSDLSKSIIIFIIDIRVGG